MTTAADLIFLRRHHFRPSDAEGLVPVTSTRGPSPAYSNTTNAITTFTSHLFVPVDVFVREFIWEWNGAGTYTLRIDGTVVGSGSVVTGPNELITGWGIGPFMLLKGNRTIQMTRNSGGSIWRFRGTDGYGDEWYQASNWSELSPNETPPLRITGTPPYNYKFLGPTPTNFSTVLRNGITYSVFWKKPVVATGIQFSTRSTTGTYQCFIDNQLVGTSFSWSGASGSGTSNGSNCILFDTPFIFDIERSYTVYIKHSAGTTFDLVGYLVASSYSDTWLSQTTWIEAAGGETPCVNWHCLV